MEKESRGKKHSEGKENKNLKERDIWDETERDGLVRYWKTSRTEEGAGKKSETKILWRNRRHNAQGKKGLTAVTVGVMRCSSVEVQCSFAGTYCLRLQDGRA
jgi:hypothetical protein